MSKKTPTTRNRKTASWQIPTLALVLLKTLEENPDPLTCDVIRRYMPKMMEEATGFDDGFAEHLSAAANELFASHEWGGLINDPAEGCVWPSPAGFLDPEAVVAAAATDGFTLGVCYAVKMLQR